MEGNPSRPEAPAAPLVDPAFPRALCRCGHPVELVGAEFVCRCGAQVGYTREGVAVLPPPTEYWGEINQAEMTELLRASQERGWRNAVSDLSRETLHNNALNPQRAAFQDILPLEDGSRVLDVGAGLGAIAAELSRRHQVCALEGVWERARFMALRKEQDRLPNLTVVNSDLNAIRFAPRQFDAIILNGVLEWVPLFDVTVAPGTAQVRLLSRLRETLRPGGWMYIGIENRFGWQQLAGAVDHSGLRYTSLLPRFLARQVCQRSGRYRSAFNVSYRTYTYSYLGYRRLFRRAGLRIAGTWFAPISYNLPTTLVPLQRAAIQHYTAMRWLSPPWTWRKRLLNLIKRAVAREWCWRLAGGDFVFVLKESHE